MRQVFWVLGCIVLGSLSTGCASECEKKCDKIFSDTKTAAGGNWGVMEETANAALKLCKSQCE